LQLLSNLTGKRKPTEDLLNFYLGAINDKKDLNPLTLLEHDSMSQAVELTATEFSQLELVDAPEEAPSVAVPQTFSSVFEGVVVLDANNNCFVMVVRVELSRLYWILNRSWGTFGTMKSIQYPIQSNGSRYQNVYFLRYLKYG
jgi:hypothetical protein